jgi:hypothetical protein
MANLIDKSYFVNDINLPAGVLQGTPAQIDAYIERYEKECLKMLLGYDLYKALKVEIDSSPQVFTTVWDELVNGAEYSNGGYTQKWNGLVNTDKVSFIAYFVFWNFVRDNVTTYESVGAMTAQSENSKRVSADDLITESWNNFVTLYNEAANFIINKQSSYPLWFFTPLKYSSNFGI